MNIVFYSIHGFDREFLKQLYHGEHQLTFLEEPLNEETVELARDNTAISIFTGDDANAKVLEKLCNIGVRYIATRSAGYDNIDLKKCRELGIKVSNVPQYSPYAIAEHAMMLLLCLNRKLKLGQQLIKNHDFRLDHLIGFNLKNKTIGIIGTGRIGSVFARIASGFGCKILAYDIKKNEALEKELGVKYVSLDELCKNSDVISLHCLLNDSTRHILNKEKFSLMKDRALIINTARGAHINTKDLIEALEKEKIAGAGLDVYEFEKGLFFEEHEEVNDLLFSQLNAKPNVIITAHQAFLTEEALSNIAETTFYNLDCWNAGKLSGNEIC